MEFNKLLLITGSIGLLFPHWKTDARLLLNLAYGNNHLRQSIQEWTK